MDIQAVLKKLTESSDAEANAKTYRELLDVSESKDSDDLRSFVEQLVSKEEPPGEVATAKDHSRKRRRQVIVHNYLPK